jgi:predicted DNA-binding protein YlxM (UPF0122 family)
MTELTTGIMTGSDYIDTHISVMTDDSMGIMTEDDYTDTHTDSIMTSDSQIQRTLGKPKQEKDPHALKIASFRTKEGVWAEFCNKAEEQGLTATDVLKAAMEQFISGEYNPSVYTPNNMAGRHHDNGLTRHDVLDIVNTAIQETLSLLEIPNEETIDRQIKSSIEELLKTNIEPLANLFAELETYTQSQFVTVREEFKKALIDRVKSSDSIAPTAPNQKQKPEGEPDWVNSDNRRFYSLLVEDSELLSKVTEAIARNNKDNAVLSKSLVEFGFYRKDGTGYDSASMSRIKGVVKNLNTSV